MRALFVLLLAGLGIVTGVLGGERLKEMASIYRPGDIAVSESPASFQAWLRDGGLTADGAPRRIAQRLLAMPLDHRRDAAAAMLKPAFWERLTAKGHSPRTIQAEVRDGLLLALRESPASGDLYLAAAWLDTVTDGFSARTQALMIAAQVYAPRELPFVVERLNLAPLVWPLLDAEGRKPFSSDFQVLRSMQPERAAQLAQRLAEDGVTLP